jgi:hypothetical protein
MVRGCLTHSSCYLYHLVSNRSYTCCNRLASQEQNPAKRAWEVFNLYYGAVWIACFAAIVAFKIYETLGKAGYMVVCCGLCIPILFQPVFFARYTYTYYSKLP